jgi:hypothetical protein
VLLAESLRLFEVGMRVLNCHDFVGGVSSDKPRRQRVVVNFISPLANHRFPRDVADGTFRGPRERSDTHIFIELEISNALNGKMPTWVSLRLCLLRNGSVILSAAPRPEHLVGRECAPYNGGLGEPGMIGSLHREGEDHRLSDIIIVAREGDRETGIAGYLAAAPRPLPLPTVAQRYLFAVDGEADRAAVVTEMAVIHDRIRVLLALD